MSKLTHINDLFRSAADIEAETPITVGAATIDSDKRFLPLAEVEESAVEFARQGVRGNPAESGNG
jgi:hypothetical protein